MPCVTLIHPSLPTDTKPSIAIIPSPAPEKSWKEDGEHGKDGDDEGKETEDEEEKVKEKMMMMIKKKKKELKEIAIQDQGQDAYNILDPSPAASLTAIRNP